ncbi:MAG: hypothetical protein FH749_05560 [Firmicutes bacterium]|nr:hypothetical protein [Bacillota bacterium]
MEQEQVYFQELDLSSGQAPLALLKQVVERQPPAPGQRLNDIGLIRDGERVLLKLYFGQAGEEEE